MEGSAFGKELANQSVGVLIGAALPGSIGIGEEYRHLSVGRQELVLGELFAIVEGDAAALLAGWLKEHAASGPVLGRDQQHEARFTIHERD